MSLWNCMRKSFAARAAVHVEHADSGTPASASMATSQVAHLVGDATPARRAPPARAPVPRVRPRSAPRASRVPVAARPGPVNAGTTYTPPVSGTLRGDGLGLGRARR